MQNETAIHQNKSVPQSQMSYHSSKSFPISTAFRSWHTICNYFFPPSCRCAWKTILLEVDFGKCNLKTKNNEKKLSAASILGYSFLHSSGTRSVDNQSNLFAWRYFMCFGCSRHNFLLVCSRTLNPHVHLVDLCLQVYYHSTFTVQYLVHM